MNGVAANVGNVARPATRPMTGQRTARGVPYAARRELARIPIAPVSVQNVARCIMGDMIGPITGNAGNAGDHFTNA